MLKKILSLALVIIWVLSTICIEPAYSSPPAVEYLCALGIQLYRQGNYNDALSEFGAVLTLEPDNKTALKYVNAIFKPEGQPVKKGEATSLPAKTYRRPGKYDVMEEALNSYDKKPTKEEAVQNALEIAGIKVSGEAQLRLGLESGNFLWKRANWDLNEKNFRVISNTAFDRRENTFDPRIYDRFRVQLDSPDKEGFGFHSNIVADPWSYTGKSDKITVTSAFGDAAEVQLKTWGNTGYTVNEIVDTNRFGNSFALPEMKVRSNSQVDPFTIKGAFSPNDTFNFPAIKIYQEFQPIREFWMDYNQENLKVRLFPIAYENQALTFDDPLKLSNNRIWWEDSPWIRDWKSGIFNSGVTPTVDFTKGYWDKTLSFFTRDSEGQRLTSLRGLSVDFNPSENTSLVSSIATPKTLWQDYSEINNVMSATRFKHLLADKFDIGITYTARLGINTEAHKTDAKNFVGATDLSYEVAEGLTANLELARSQSNYDLTTSQFETDKTGNAYYFSLVGRYPREKIIETKYGYDGIQPEDKDRFFSKFRFFFSRMDESFDQPLSSYVETRDDEFWGRHIHFRQPFKYYYQGEGQMLSWDDIKNFRIGNGIDIGRTTTGLRVESQLWDKRVDNLLDVRNVRTPEGKFVENVVREELTWQVNDKLTSKLLGIYNKLPQTKAGTDPFIFNTSTGRYYDNVLIQDDTDPSLKTGSLGMEYAFFDWLSLNGIWEYTNDYSLGYDNFPRGIFNDGSLYSIYYENGNKYRNIGNFLYYQQFFPTPPYPYYNIIKSGLDFTLSRQWNFYLDYTRNPFEKAGQVDDNMNHVGLELVYTPTPKFSAMLKYTYSRWQDIDHLISSGKTKLTPHYNVFLEFIYRRSKYEDLTFQYGEASRNPYMGGVLDIGWDPYGGSLKTIDTAHIFRLYYRRKF